MYQPNHFKEEDRSVLQALMIASPLATIVRAAPDGLAADHIPLMFVAADALGGDRLIGHVARANTLWQDAHDRPVLAIFQGAQSYISPSWYPTKQETGKVVPTYNYAVVHARGHLRAIDDALWVHGLVDRLTQRFEHARDKPWHVGDAPDDYIAQMVRAIVGIEIAVTRLEGKWKVSQNRSSEDRNGVANGLAAETPTALSMHALVSQR